MREDTKTLLFAAAVCATCSLLLSGTAAGLRNRQQANEAFDVKRNIVKAFGIGIGKMKRAEIEATYEKHVSAKTDGELELYTWTDEDGNLHMTQYPPPEGAKLKEVTSYSKKTEIQKSDNQEPQKSQATDNTSKKKSKEADAAQRRADAAAKKAHKANVEAADAVLKAYETRDKSKAQGREARDRLYREDVRKSERDATRAQAEAREVQEKAKKASENAKEAQEREKE